MVNGEWSVARDASRATDHSPFTIHHLLPLRLPRRGGTLVQFIRTVGINAESVASRATWVGPAFELPLDALLATLPALFDQRLLVQLAEGLQLFGREHAAHAQLGLRTQAHERGLRVGNVARALFDQSLVNRVGVDGLVERAPSLVETLVERPRLRHVLALDGAHLRDLVGRQVELLQQSRGVVGVSLRGRAFLRLRGRRRGVRLRARGGDGEEKCEGEPARGGDEGTAGRGHELLRNGSVGQRRRSPRLALLRGIDRAEQVCEPRHASLLSRGEVVLVIFDYGELRAAPRRPPRALLTSLQRGVARGELLLLQLGLKEADALRVLILKPRALVRHATVNALPDGGVELLLRVAALNRHLNLLFHDVLLNAGSEGEAVRVPADFRARERQSGQPADDEQRGHAARLKPQRREREELAQRSQRRTLPLRRGMRTRGERQLLANVEQGDCAQHLRAPLADHLAHRAERGQLCAADGAAVEVDAKRLRLFGRGLAVEVRDQLLGTPAAARVRAVVQARGVRLLSHCGATSN